MSKVCIIGGLGFLGSHLCDALKAAGHHVTVIDNESQSSVVPLNSSADTVHLSDAANLQFYNQVKYDYVFHCASPCGPATISPGYALEKIIELTKVGLDFAQRTGARFVKFSTSEVYGRSDTTLFESTSALISPAYDARSEYSIGFIAAECLCFTHPHPDVQVLRLFNVVGPRQSSKTGAVMPRLIEQAKAGDPLTIFGDGNQSRGFLDVSDFTAFCLLLMDNWPKEKGTWNVANPSNAITMLQLAGLVSNEIGGTPNHLFIGGSEIWPHYRDGVEKRHISIDKARSIGWVPKLGIREIIQKCLSAT